MTLGLVLSAVGAALLLTQPVATQGGGPQGGRTVVVDGFEAAAGDVLVKFDGALGDADRQQLDNQMDADQDDGIGGLGVRRIHSRSYDTETLLAFLRTEPRVVYAEPNYIVHAVATPNDPQFATSHNLWGLQNTGQTLGCGGSCYGSATGVAGADISAVSAWDIAIGSRANVVAVVDTGIDYNHPDLAANVWSAPAAFSVVIGGKTINCAAGTHGFKSINNTATMTCDPLDDNNHGSHTSGTIGGAGNNGVGVVGVNWVASIMGAKFLDAGGSGYTSDAINVMEFAIQANANVRVLSNSWGGGGFSQALLDEINKANTKNMLFVAAAGNNASNNDTSAFYPANYSAPNVLAVAATTNTDQLASFSNFGATKVHLGAPGQDVLSTTRNNTYSYFSGTSMATPHVAGAAALVLSACALNTASLKSTILANVDPTLTGWVSSGGRLNVNKAIRACSGPPTPDFSVSATPSSRTVVQGTGTTYTATVTALGGFAGTVTFSATGLPAGAAASFTPTSVTPSGSSTVGVTTSSTTPTGTYIVTITGTSGTLVRSTNVTLVVTAPATPNFTLSASPSSRTVTRGGSTTYTTTIARSGGFTASVLLSLSGLPSGATGTFSSPNPVTGTSSTLTVKTVSTTPTGTFTLTITGTSGALVRTTTVKLVVNASCNGEC